MSPSQKQAPAAPSADGGAMRVLQLFFLAVAIGVMASFANAARDGEQRRSPDTLVQMLQPNYVGNNRLAPDFTLVDRQGHSHSLAEFRGRTVVLHFWSRTCLPCVEELYRSIAVFDEIVRDRKDITLLLVSADAGWTAVAPVIPPSLSALLLFDPTRSVITEKYGTTLFPETWVIDRSGYIRARFDHPLAWESTVFLGYLTSL